jgi:hypothetical protein
LQIAIVFNFIDCLNSWKGFSTYPKPITFLSKNARLTFLAIPDSELKSYSG